MGSSFLNLEQIRQQITTLLVECPELEQDEVLRADMIEGNTAAIEFLRELERRRREACAMMTGLEAVITELEKRAERFVRRTESLKRLMRIVLDAANLKKVELPEATLIIRSGVPKVMIVVEADLPDYYWRVHREPNKQLIGAALKSGADVPGAVLSNSEPQLTIRIK